MNALVADLNEGKIGALLVYGVNPAYDYYDAEKFKSGLKKVKASISFNDRLDETTELMQTVSCRRLISWKAGAIPNPNPASSLSCSLRSPRCSKRGLSKTRC